MDQSTKRSSWGYPKKKESLNRIKPKARYEKEKRNLFKLIPKLRKIKGK
jgi:hypothetical protein